MATTTFKKVQKKINEIVSIEIQSDKYVQDTVFLKKMKSIYQKIRNDAKAQIDNLLKNQYQKTVLVFYRLPECIDSDFRQTQSLELNQFITALTVQLDELTPFTERFYALPVKVQNHDLMKNFLQEINNRLETIQVHHEINELSRLVDNINSRFLLSAILKRYQSLKNTYPALKSEIKAKISQNQGDDFSYLANYCEERLEKIQELTNSIHRLPEKIKKHTLMTSFLAELKNNLTAENIDQWNTLFNATVDNINSRFSLSAILKRYQSLKNIYPALKSEIKAKISQNQGNNLTGLANYCEKKLSKIQQLTDSIHRLPEKVKKHNLMTSFLAELKGNLTTKNFDQWNTKYHAKIIEYQAEIRHSEGWDMGDYHCYGDGVIYDKRTELYWYVAHNHAYFSQAGEIIAKLNKRQYHGFNNWRLPSNAELGQIRDIGETGEVYVNVNIYCWTNDISGYWKSLMHSWHSIIKKCGKAISDLGLIGDGFWPTIFGIGISIFFIILAVFIMLCAMIWRLFFCFHDARCPIDGKTVLGTSENQFVLLLVRG